jgi:hypothetical protein
VSAAQGQVMEFTKEEQKMIEWLRNQHKGWRTTRMITLVASCMCGVFAIFELIKGGSQWLVLGLICSYGTSYTLGSWHGRPEISLLLKLIDERQKEAQPCGLDNCCKGK